METSTKIAFAALGGGVLYLLLRSSDSSASKPTGAGCVPPEPVPSKGLPLESYELVSLLWNPAECVIDGVDNRLAVTKSEAEGMRANLGKPIPASAAGIVPAGRVGYLWVFDDKGSVFFRGVREGDGPVNAW
jgi:hypothetical protein